MDTVRFAELLKEFNTILSSGPGKDDAGLARVVAIVDAIRSDSQANDYVRRKASAVQDSFETWLSPRMWYGRSAGRVRARQDLHANIHKLAGSLRTADRLANLP